MTSEFKKNFALSVVLHVVVLAMICFVTAFVPAPRIDTTIVMEIVGGGGDQSEPGPPPPPAPPAPPPPPQPKIEQPVQEEKKPDPPKPEPVRIVQPKPPEMVIPEKKVETPKKKVEEKPKVEPKPEPKKPEAKKVEAPKKDTKAKLISKAEYDKKTNQPRPSAKPDPKYSRDSIRQRLAKNVITVESLGGGPGPAGAAGSDFQAYCSMVSMMLYEVWDIPGQVTPDMSALVVVHITQDGSISFVKLAKPSGSASMDESAIQAVKRRVRVDPIPASLGRSLDLTVLFKPLGA